MKREIRLYVALIALVLVVEQTFNQTLESFQECELDLRIEIDASPGEVRVVRYAVNCIMGKKSSHEIPVGGRALNLGTPEFVMDANF